MDMWNLVQSGYSNEAVRPNIVVAFGTNDLHVFLRGANSRCLQTSSGICSC